MSTMVTNISSLAELEGVPVEVDEGAYQTAQAQKSLNVDNITLGVGSFGCVQKVRIKGTQEIQALKIMKKADIAKGNLNSQVSREIQVQKKVNHPNVLRLYAEFCDDSNIYLLLEYCRDGELYQILKKEGQLPEPRACRYFKHVSAGLQHLHSNSIIHRDLKPENLLVSGDDTIKIADFGWCAICDSFSNAKKPVSSPIIIDNPVIRSRTTFCGTLDYLAPEMIQGTGHDHTLDIWMAGVLLFECVKGRPPFQSRNHAVLIMRVLSLQIQWDAGMRAVSADVQDVIARMLITNPLKRAKLADLDKHPWLMAGGKCRESIGRVSRANTLQDSSIGSGATVVNSDNILLPSTPSTKARDMTPFRFQPHARCVSAAPKMCEAREKATPSTTKRLAPPVPAKTVAPSTAQTANSNSNTRNKAASKTEKRPSPRVGSAFELPKRSTAATNQKCLPTKPAMAAHSADRSHAGTGKLQAPQSVLVQSRDLLNHTPLGLSKNIYSRQVNQRNNPFMLGQKPLMPLSSPRDVSMKHASASPAVPSGDSVGSVRKPEGRAGAALSAEYPIRASPMNDQRSSDKRMVYASPLSSPLQPNRPNIIRPAESPIPNSSHNLQIGSISASKGKIPQLALGKFSSDNFSKPLGLSNLNGAGNPLLNMPNSARAFRTAADMLSNSQEPPSTQGLKLHPSLKELLAEDHRKKISQIGATGKSPGNSVIEQIPSGATANSNMRPPLITGFCLRNANGFGLQTKLNTARDFRNWTPGPARDGNNLSRAASPPPVAPSPMLAPRLGPYTPLVGSRGLILGGASHATIADAMTASGAQPISAQRKTSESRADQPLNSTLMPQPLSGIQEVVTPPLSTDPGKRDADVVENGTEAALDIAASRSKSSVTTVERTSSSKQSCTTWKTRDFPRSKNSSCRSKTSAHRETDAGSKQSKGATSESKSSDIGSATTSHINRPAQVRDRITGSSKHVPSASPRSDNTSRSSSVAGIRQAEQGNQFHAVTKNNSREETHPSPIDAAQPADIGTPAAGAGTAKPQPARPLGDMRSRILQPPGSIFSMANFDASTVTAPSVFLKPNLQPLCTGIPLSRPLQTPIRSPFDTMPRAPLMQNILPPGFGKLSTNLQTFQPVQVSAEMHEENVDSDSAVPRMAQPASARLSVIANHVAATKDAEILDFENSEKEMAQYFASDCCKEIYRPYSAADIARFQGSRGNSFAYPAAAMARKLRQILSAKEPSAGSVSWTISISNPASVSAMAAAGLKTVYVNSSGSCCSQDIMETVPQRVEEILQAQTLCHRKQRESRLRKSPEWRRENPPMEYTMPIIADAAHGHGGLTALMQLTSSLIEAGAAGISISDDKSSSSTEKSVLMSNADFIRRITAARMQADIMKVPVVIVAKLNFHRAQYLENDADPRDHQFILGVTKRDPKHSTYTNALRACRKTQEWDQATSVMTYPELVESILSKDSSKAAQVGAWRTALSTKALSLREMIALGEKLGAGRPYFNWNACRSPKGYYRVRASMGSTIQRAKSVGKYCDALWIDSPVSGEAGQNDVANFSKELKQACPHIALVHTPGTGPPGGKLSEDESKGYISNISSAGFVLQIVGGPQSGAAVDSKNLQAINEQGPSAIHQLGADDEDTDAAFVRKQVATLSNGLLFSSYAEHRTHLSA